MKSEHSIRNRFRSKLLRCAALGTLLFVCASAVPMPARLNPAALEVHADQLTNDKIKEKEGEIASTKKERSELESGLSNVKKIKAELEKNKSDLAAYITQLDGNLEEIQANIEALKEKIVEKEQQITETEAELEEAIAVQEAQYEAMKQRIRMMYLKGDTFYLDLLFSMEGSYGDMLNKAGYIEKIEEYDRNKLNEYMEQTRLVELTKESLEEEKVTLDEAKEAVEEEEANVKALLSEKEAQINAVNADIQTKEQSIAAYEADIAQRDAEIAALEKIIQEERARLAEEQRRKYDGGMFAWPCPGYSYISSEYGYRVHPIYGYQLFHNGVDMAASSGTPILAAYSGKVIAAAYSSSMGNYVMIDHGDGLITIYMHASALYVSSGQEVSRGQQIAAVGSTGNSTGPHMHFSTRLNGSYVSPWNYLSK